ncbi:hypothetical protein Golax_020574 [Gossypium laxum]|uniref:DUF7745 domain-containing protein n=1 Tax=Gossypium laxum TaxID=34288 RepID=A0A7J9AYL6_9ROSI|nr:hypothetical protein [Gossypium laxum]
MGQWDGETNQLFYCNYDDLPYLLDVDLVPTVEEYTTFLRCRGSSLQELKEVYLVPTIEEYTILLSYLRIQADKAYSKVANVLSFLKKLMSITGMNTKKRVNVFTLSIYGLVIFPKALEHIDEAYRLRQFLPATQGLAQCEFTYKGDNYNKKFGTGEKDRTIRGKDAARIRCRRTDVRGREDEKGKNKVEEDLDSLKIDYKKLRLLIKIASFLKQTMNTGESNSNALKVRLEKEITSWVKL